MRIFTHFLALVLAGSTVAAAQAPAAADDDRRAITRTIQLYFDGWAIGDSAMLGRAMHASTHLKRSLEGKFVDMTREQYVGGMRLHARDTTLQTRIVYLDIVGTIAQARTEISIGTRTFVDFFNLLKTSDGWFIVDKVAAQVPRGSTTPPQNVAPTRPRMPVLETGDRQPATPVERGASFGT